MKCKFLRVGQTFEACRDVDAITEDVAVLQHDVADVDPDAKAQAPRFVERLVCDRDLFLDVDRALHGREYAREFGQNAVTRRPEDASAVLRDQLVGDGPVRRQGVERAFLVDLHQPAVTFDIGGKDGDKFSFEGRCFHSATNGPCCQAVAAHREQICTVLAE